METLHQAFDDSKYRPSLLLKQICHVGYLGKAVASLPMPRRDRDRAGKRRDASSTGAAAPRSAGHALR
jgi:hypothetical protein